MFLLGCAAPLSLLVQPMDMDTRPDPDLPLHRVLWGRAVVHKDLGRTAGPLAWCEHEKQPSSLRAAFSLWGTEQSILHDLTLLKTD